MGMGGGWGGRGHAKKKKMAFEGAPSQKIRERGGHVKYFSKTLKWHNVLINEALEFKRKKRAKEKAKESWEAKEKSYEDYP